VKERRREEKLELLLPKQELLPQAIIEVDGSVLGGPWKDI
jgi:hypothetical protein